MLNVCIFPTNSIINHWYFIRHLKRWMICANEISIIYGSIRQRAQERDGAVCFSNLRFVFIVFYVWQRVRAWLGHERVPWEELKWKRICFYKMRVIQRIVKRTMLDFYFFFCRRSECEKKRVDFLVVFHVSHIQHEIWEEGGRRATQIVKWIF